MESFASEKLPSDDFLGFQEVLTLPDIPGAIHVHTDTQQLSIAYGMIYAATNPDIVKLLNRSDKADSHHKVQLPGNLQRFAEKEFLRKVDFIMFDDNSDHMKINFPDDHQTKLIVGINPTVIAKAVASDAPYWKCLSRKPLRIPPYSNLSAEGKIIVLRDVLNRCARLGLTHAILQERGIVPIIAEDVKQKTPLLGPFELGALAFLMIPFMRPPESASTLHNLIAIAGATSAYTLVIRGILTHDRNPEQTAVKRFAIDLIDSRKKELSTINPITLDHEL